MVSQHLETSSDCPEQKCHAFRAALEGLLRSHASGRIHGSVCCGPHPGDILGADNPAAEGKAPACRAVLLWGTKSLPQGAADPQGLLTTDRFKSGDTTSLWDSAGTISQVLPNPESHQTEQSLSCKHCRSALSSSHSCPIPEWTLTLYLLFSAGSGLKTSLVSGSGDEVLAVSSLSRYQSIQKRNCSVGGMGNGAGKSHVVSGNSFFGRGVTWVGGEDVRCLTSKFNLPWHQRTHSGRRPVCGGL